MSNRGINTLKEVTKSEYPTALFGVILEGSGGREARKTTLARMANSQQRRNARRVMTERIVLVKYTGVDTNNRVREGHNVNNDLDMKPDSTRHSFEDGSTLR